MDHTYQKTTLPNGLRVMKLHMPAVHSVFANLYVKSGWRLEKSSESGISHFVEHMLFKGTTHYSNSREISEAVDNIGADINGSTMPEYSEFSLIVHPRHLADGMRIFGDFLTNSTFDSAEVENEKEIIAEELSQYSDIAGDSVNLDELACSLMWPMRSMSCSALGSYKTIKSFSRRQLIEHYRDHYVPSNMVLSVAGNYDPDKLDALLAEHFGDLSGEATLREPEYETGLGFPRSVYKRMPSRMAYMKLCHEACSYRDPNLILVLVISDILGGGISSRLFSTLREELGLVYDVSSGATMYSDVGSIDVITSTKASKLIPTLKCVLEQIRILADGGVTEEELARVKDRVACQMDFMLDSPADLNEWFGLRELLTSPEEMETPDDEMERLRSVTAEDLNRVVREYMVPGRRGLVLVGAGSWRQRRQIAKLLEQ